MRRLLAPLLLALTILLATPAAAFAADYYVAIGGDDATGTGAIGSPFASVQKAIDIAANGGGNVHVGAGTFTGNITLKNGVSLYGAGASETTLTVTSGRVITISGIGASETVAGFAITGGSAVSGAGIYCADSSPVIRENIIVGNTVFSTGWDDSPRGGGIYCYRGGPTITNNLVTGNAVSGRYAQGGGIATWYSTAVISGNTVTGNSVAGESDSAGTGGGISCSSGTCTVVGNVVFGNTASGNYAEGGGISVDLASAQVTDNMVHDNLVESDSWGSSSGGGIHFSRSSGAVSRNFVRDNIARGEYTQGGGIAFDAGWDVYTPTISANVVTGNIADGTGSSGMGGGISISDGSPSVSGNIISGNTALGEYGGEGGGLYCSSFWEDHVSRPVITNNVITANLAGGAWGGSGGGVYFSSSPAVVRNNTIAGNRVEGDTPGAGGVVAENFWGRGWPSIMNSILWGNTGAEISGVGITYSCVEGGAAGEGNISSNPLFLDATAGRYELTAGSPASDVASPTVAPAVDIRGVARPQGAGYDMGAYEFTPMIPVESPVAGADAYAATEDVTLVVRGRGVLANDTVAIERGPLTASIETSPTHGSLELAADGSFTYVPDADWSGADTFAYRIADTSGAEATATVTITVQPVPDPPVLTFIGPKTGDELTELTFSAAATDIDTPLESLVFSLGAGAPSEASIDPVTGVFTWTPTEEQGPDAHLITVVVSDGTHIDTEMILVTVAEVNIAPVLDAIGPMSADELTPLTFTATATDMDVPANTLTFALGDDAPAGASIDATTGAFTWTPTEEQGPGAYEITLIASDGVLEATETITVTVAEVNIAPVLDAIGDASIDELTPLTFTATATDVDLPANTLTYSLADGAPAGASIDAATGVFTWTPTEAQGPDPYEITVIASDGTLEATETITVTVAEVSTDPVLGWIGNQAVALGETVGFTATATDGDLPANTLTYSLQAAPPGATIDPVTGAFSWTPPTTGSFGTIVRVSDGIATDFQVVVITIAEPADTIAPPAPADVTATPLSPTSISITWSASADASGIRYYTVYLDGVAATTVADTSTIILGLTPGTTYSFTVVAVDGSPASNVSVPSATANATTLSLSDTTAPVITIEGVTAGATYDTSVKITVSALDSVDGTVTPTLTLNGQPFVSGGAVATLGTYALVAIAEDTAGNSSTRSIVFTLVAPAPRPTVIEVAGDNRVGTAIAASRLGFPEGSKYVLIATAHAFPDALGGSALAGALDAPILLTEPDVLSEAVAAEIARLGTTHIIVLGGEGAVSADVYDKLAGLPDVTMVERIAGPTRYETAEQIAARTIEELGESWDGTAFVATGETFPDALGASPLAAAKGWPIYLVNPASADHRAFVAAMEADGVTRVLILGGEGALPAMLETALDSTFGEAAVERLAGENRYATAAAIATYGVEEAGLAWDRLAIATGENFPDALAGGALQGRNGSVMLLVHTDVLHAEVAEVLGTNKASIAEVRFLGGAGAVPQALRNAVVQALQ